MNYIAIPGLKREMDPTVDRIVMAVSIITGIPIKDILGKCRESHIVVARHMAYYAVKQVRKGITFFQVGKFFSRDHTTVLYGVKKIAMAMQQDSDILEQYLAIKNKLL